MDLLTPSSRGVLQPCFWPLKAPVTLEEGRQACRQPSDASTPWYMFVAVDNYG